MRNQAARFAGRAGRARARRAAAVLALMCLGPATAASAQLAPGVSGTSSLRMMDSEEAMRTLGAFGVCYANENMRGAWTLIATEPGSREEAETYRRLFRIENQPCLGDADLRVPIALTRGAIAEGLYKRSVAVPSNLIVAPPLRNEVRTLSEAARCYTAAHPEEVRSLITSTRAGSRQEFEALSAMAPDFFACVPETARGREFNVTQLRFRLAEALLRLAAPTASSGQR